MSTTDIHICNDNEIDETITDEEFESIFNQKVRHAILSAPEFAIGLTESKVAGGDYIEKFCCIIYYACVCHKGQGHIKIMVKNPKELLDTWEKLIVGLATSHSKDERDQHEHDIDDALSPILSAPVRQIRDMFGALVDRLKANPVVPFYTWRSIEMWYEKVVLPAKAERIITLKTKLATEISRMVEEDVKADIGEAIIGALMWRDPKELKEMKDILVEDSKTDKPAQVKVKREISGRQSCIFLNVKGSKGEKMIML